MARNFRRYWLSKLLTGMAEVPTNSLKLRGIFAEKPAAHRVETQCSARNHRRFRSAVFGLCTCATSAMYLCDLPFFHSRLGSKKPRRNVVASLDFSEGGCGFR